MDKDVDLPRHALDLDRGVEGFLTDALALEQRARLLAVSSRKSPLKAADPCRRARSLGNRLEECQGLGEGVHAIRLRLRAAVHHTSLPESESRPRTTCQDLAA